MSVYVDEMVPCVWNRKWPYSQACHLVADTVEELHAFAEWLGLHRSWFQPKSIPHYDLTKGMRRKAIGLGALPVNRKQFSKIVHRLRKTGG